MLAKQCELVMNVVTAGGLGALDKLSLYMAQCSNKYINTTYSLKIYLSTVTIANGQNSPIMAKLRMPDC